MKDFFFSHSAKPSVALQYLKSRGKFTKIHLERCIGNLLQQSTLNQKCTTPTAPKKFLNRGIKTRNVWFKINKLDDYLNTIVKNESGKKKQE